MMGAVPLFAERILNSLPLGLLVALLPWSVLRLGGKQNSRTRFIVWFVALLGIAVVPFLHRSPLLAQDVRSAKFTLPSFWATVTFGIWAALFFFAFMRIVVGLWSLRRLRLSSEPLDLDSCHPDLREAIVAIQGSHKISVHISEMQAVPAAIGFFEPIILIPGWALRELPVQELRTILLHEFAHIQRRDSWTNLAQKLVKAVFFFHPAVWWIDRQLCLEREMACDDAVLSTTGDPHAYAACLVSLAERGFLHRSIALAQTAVSRVCETSLRVMQILNVNRPQRAAKPAFAMFAAFAAASLALLAGTPPLIAFQNSVNNSPVVASADSGKAVASFQPHVPHRSAENAPAVVVPAAFKPRAASHHVQRKKVLATTVPLQTPKPVLAAFPQQQSGEMFLVVRTAQYDGMGRALLSVTVWRVSMNPQSTSEGNGALPKSI